MELAEAFAQLHTALRQAVAEHFAYLLKFIEDSARQRAAQQQDDNKLVEDYEDSVQQIIDHLNAAAMAADEGLKAVEKKDPNGARTKLIETHQALLKIFDDFSTDIAGHKVLNCLEQLKPPQWRKWVCTIKESLPDCADALRAISDALLECWSALSVRPVSTEPGTGTNNPTTEDSSNAVVGGLFA